MQRIFFKRAIIVGVIGTVLVIILLVFENSATCSIRQISLQTDIQNYDTTKDPETCDNINNRIIQLDNQCNTDIAILDCG